MKRTNNSLTKVVIVLCIFISSLSASLSATAEGQNFLYTISNIAGENSIVGYRVESDGTLVELDGSPFPTGGSGSGVVIFNQAGIVASEDGKYVFAINQGSSTLTIFEVMPNGYLKRLRGSPFPTGGIFPVSLALNDDLLYVSHAGADFMATCAFCNIQGHRIAMTGDILRAFPLQDAVVSFDTLPPAVPFAIGFNPEGTTLVASRFPFADNPAPFSNIDTFQVNAATGELTPAPGSPLVTQDPEPAGFAFRPSNPSQLLLTNIVALGEQSGTLTSYLLADTGQLTPIFDTSFSSGDQQATCWVDFTGDGKYAFATNTFSDSITTYAVDEAGLLELLEIEPVPNDSPIPAFPLEIVVSDDDRFVYTINGQGAFVAAYSTSDGLLEPLAQQPAPLPAGSVPFGLVFVNR